jgi:predicted CopG family antitoxin
MDSEFPMLESSCVIDHSTYFKEQTVFLFFNLTRKNDKDSIAQLAQIYHDILILIKSELIKHRQLGYPDSDFTYLPFLDLCYKLVVNTRDIFHGKGEHDLFYMMIYELYKVFPTLAIFLLYQINNYGCWRDIKYLCNYIRQHSVKKENDSFINVCIELLNNQLKKDVDSWMYSINAGSRNHVSNVAKWIPREKNSFEWIFEKLVIHWSNHYCRWKLDSIDKNSPSYISAVTKCKRHYRKIISKMNKYLDTTEIKQCSQQWQDIHPDHVSKYTFMKQPSLFLANYHEIEHSDTWKDMAMQINKIHCSFKYIEKMNTQCDHMKYEKYDIIQLPVSYFIKEGFRLLKLDSQHRNTIKLYEHLNKKWLLFSKNHTYKLSNILPMLDLSYKMLENDAESFYTGIGLSILVAERSSFGKRILVLENTPVWINLENSKDFMSFMETIRDFIRSNQNTSFSFERGIDFLMEAFQGTQSVIRNMRLLLFSNNLHNNMDSYYDYLQKQSTLLNVKPPQIVFWNLSKVDICELPAHSENIILLSGFSSSLLKYAKTFYSVHNENSEASISFPSAYEIVVRILEKKQYSIYSDYLQKCVSN